MCYNQTFMDWCEYSCEGPMVVSERQFSRVVDVQIQDDIAFFVDKVVLAALYIINKAPCLSQQSI